MSATADAAHKLHTELPKAQQIAGLLQKMAAEEEIDPQLLLDTIEGETDLLECIDQVYARIAEDEIVVEGIKAAQAALSARKSRVEKSIDTHRNLILMAMDRLEIKGPIKRPCATFSVRVVPEKLEVVEESDIPAKFWVPQDPKLDTKALRQALADGEPVEGARLTDKGIGLTIRVK